MLRSLDHIRNVTLQALDGEIGRCRDYIFDDRSWAIRYMVADTGKWLPGRTVLIPPQALKKYAWESDVMVVDLTTEAVKSSPPLESDLPVSLQYEKRLFEHHRWPYRWIGTESWGAAPFMDHSAGFSKPEQEEPSPEESHLRSVKEVSGYRIQATDHAIGHVEDFLVEEDDWVIRYIVIDTRNWLPGRKVLISPSWADAIDYTRRRMHIRMNRSAVEHSPRYDPDQMLERADEERLFEHYAESPYWKKNLHE
ncbi:MAG: PRC-barrel domain-containing protein [Desulfobacterales bacterium]